MSGSHRVRDVLTPRRRLAPVSEAELSIADLAPSLDRYTIAALADLHHTPHADVAWLSHAIDTVNATAPDLIVLLGDYGESFRRSPILSRRWYREALDEMTPYLARLRARDGMIAVLGNHDYYAGAEMVRAWLQRLGAEVLVNRARNVERPGGALRIAGMDDLREGRTDRFAGCDVASRVPTVVLSHNPDGILYLDPRLRVDGVLAGHTHGGQIVIPAYGALVTMARTCGRRSASGWVRNARAPLYVTRGLGQQLPIPIRINCPPEIVVMRLKSGVSTQRTHSSTAVAIHRQSAR